MKLALFILIALSASSSSFAEQCSPQGAQKPNTDYVTCQQGGAVDDSRLSNPEMAKALKFLREKVGHVMFVTSAYRSPGKQASVARQTCGRASCGGRSAVSKASQHSYGTAADFAISEMSIGARCALMRQVRDYIGHGGAGAENGAAHFDIRDGKSDFGACGSPGYSSSIAKSYRSMRRNRR